METVKETSRQLRGTIDHELETDSDHFGDQDKQLLKFHGSYQQEDRDARKTRKKGEAGKEYIFMVRCKIPGGRLTAKQYLAVDDLAGACGNGTVRLTSRQGIQLHGVLKSHLKETIAGINECLLTTLGACGDVERNVMACPAPHYHHGIHAQLQETAAAIAAHLAPRTRAYHEIWLNGKQLFSREPKASAESGGPGADNEPLYGKVYLPRKFKTGLALPEDNCVDVYGQDLGLLAIVENGRIAGYNVLVGGGMGMTHGNANTFPYLAKPICYVPAQAVVSAAEAVVKLFRDHGNRADRKRARIKYLVHDWGVDKFRQVLSEYIGGELQLPRPIEVRGYETHLGWHPQGNGKWYYGISVQNGRVKDEGEMRLRSGLRALVERYQPALRITPVQDLLLCDLDASARGEVERTLAEFGIRRPEQISTVQRYSLACPALPTCGLALSESERVMPGLINQIEGQLKRLGLEDEKLSVRMTGCPNGCARPYQSDIGIVGRSGDKYTLFVGGGILGNRLNFMLKDLVPLAEIVPTLVPLLESFKQERRPEEGFGDYCFRLGADRLQAMLSSSKEARQQTERNGTIAPETGNGEVALSKHANGDRQLAPASTVAPEIQPVQLTLAPPDTLPVPVAAPGSAKCEETILAGTVGEELPDCTFRFHSDGAVRETIVYFYGDDRRAAGARLGDPLRRQAVYQGKVNSVRLFAARKLSDTYFVGPAGEERPDRRVEYYPDGQIARTVTFYYEGDQRAADAPPGAALRRQIESAGSPD
jgi:sulfite reductase (ferredoxin)